MTMCKRWFIKLILLLLVTGVYAKEIDEETGLIIDDHFELVKTTCIACHSAKNITGQTGSRLTWLGLIRWMQNTQGLETFDTNTESNILDYLETNYGVKEGSYRRAAISPFLMPPNPYQTQATIKFVGLEENYQIGEPVNVSLAIDFQEAYSKGYLDLWIALHLPNTSDSLFYFMTSIPSVTETPQSFLSSLKSVDSTHLLMDFPMPPIEKGAYTFYALLVERSANPMNEVDINRSPLLIQAMSVE